MRTSRLAMLMLGVISVAGLAGTAPAVAGAAPAVADPYDYPWCLQGKETGYPGACFYQTYEQCQASASGRHVYCGINPRFAFNQAPPQPRYVRRAPRY